MPSRVTRLAAILTAGAVLGGLSPIAAQSPAVRIDTSRALTIQYADGRKITNARRHAAAMWTQAFPKVPGATASKDGLPLTTLHVRYVVDHLDLVVTVSVSYGGPLKPPVEVATVRVKPDGITEVPE